MSNQLITTLEDKHKGQSFVHIDRSLGKIKKGEKYQFIEYDPGAEEKKGFFFGRWVCIDTKEITLDQVTPALAALDKNCELDVYREIMIRHRKIKPNDKLVVATFTQECNTKKYWSDAKIHN